MSPTADTTEEAEAKHGKLFVDGILNKLRIALFHAGPQQVTMETIRTLMCEANANNVLPDENSVH